METQSFLFDVIVVKIATETENDIDIEDPHLLTVDVEFNNSTIPLTSKSICVLDFPPNKSFEFTAKTEELRTQMREKPIHLIVKYDSEILGNAYFRWPASIYEKVATCTEELSHFDVCDFFSETEKIGVLEVKIRLQAKCGQQGDIEGATCEDYRQNIDKIIDPGDVFFMVEGGPQIDCANGEKDDDGPPPFLDLSRYRTVNGQIIKSADIVNACENGCCELADCKAYNNLIRAICGKNEDDEKTDPLQDLAKMCNDLKSNYACKATKHVPECPHSCKFSDNEEEENKSCKNCCECSKCCCPRVCYCECCQKCPKPRVIICTADPPPKCEEADVCRPKCCPICNLDLSWLPNMAACPSCGYKPVPFVEEKPYNETLTTEQILRDHLNAESKESSSGEEGSSATSDEDERKSKKNKGRCKCENGKVCAHCRIKKFLEEMLQPKSKVCKKPKGTSETNLNKKKSKASESDDACFAAGDSDGSRIFLSRVFSELRDLHDIKVTTKKKKLRDQEACGKPVKSNGARKSGGADEPNNNNNNNSNSRAKGSRSGGGDEPDESSKKKKRKSKRLTRADFEVQNYNEEIKKKFCKKKPNNKFILPPPGQYPGVQIGHKECIPEMSCKEKWVPPNMGWLWTMDSKAGEDGWRPGAIRKPIQRIMKYFLKKPPNEQRYACKPQKKCEPDNNPILHVCKKQGDYYITLRPLQQATLLKECMKTKVHPITFRITKNPISVQKSEIKRELKEIGFAKCTCHKPVMNCCCRGFLERKRLEFELCKACRNRCIPNVKDSLVLSDTTDSDSEFQFGVTPPAGMLRPPQKRKPRLVNSETQYRKKDLTFDEDVPTGPNKYLIGLFGGGGPGFSNKVPKVKGICRQPI